MTIQESFEQSFRYSLDHEDELMLKYKNKVVAIYLNRVLGVYESTLDAYLNVPKQHGVEPGSFIIKTCSPQEPRYVKLYHSNSDLG